MKSNFQSNFLKYEGTLHCLNLKDVELKEFGIAIEFETQCWSSCMQNGSLAAIEHKKISGFVNTC